MLNTVLLNNIVPTNPSCGKPHRDEHSNELGQSERVFVDLILFHTITLNT